MKESKWSDGSQVSLIQNSHNLVYHVMVCLQFARPVEALSCLLQVGWSLAVAEDACEFEHRDLHWGNVLIAQDSTPSITYKFHSTGQQFAYKVDTSGIRVNIIDFTLSRLRKGKVLSQLLTLRKFGHHFRSCLPTLVYIRTMIWCFQTMRRYTLI